MFFSVATQGERKAETRERLLAAAAELFAERGIEASSVDAIAERAERTSGAIYDHFGGKPGLLFALLEGWTDAAAEVIGAEVASATTLDERLHAIWRNVVSPPRGDGGQWILLEHELWSYAARDDDARAHLARRYRAAWASVDRSLQEWAEQEGVATPPPAAGSAVIGVLLGLDMMRRIDPDAIDTDTAIGALRGAVGATRTEALA
jgi:AcrR family transcriptional regulator